MEMVYYHSPPPSGSFNNSTFTGNTVFSSNTVFQQAVTFNQPVTASSEFNFTGPVTFTGDAVYQGSSRHTANVSIRASLAVQQFEFTSNTGQTLFKGSSDSQGLLSYTLVQSQYTKTVLNYVLLLTLQKQTQVQ